MMQIALSFDILAGFKYPYLKILSPIMHNKNALSNSSKRFTESTLGSEIRREQKSVKCIPNILYADFVIIDEISIY